MVYKHVFTDLVSLNKKKVASTNFENWRNHACVGNFVPHALIGFINVVPKSVDY